MDLADDLRAYVAIPTPIEDIPAGAEVDLGTDQVERVLDADTAAERDETGAIVHVVRIPRDELAGSVKRIDEIRSILRRAETTEVGS